MQRSTTADEMLGYILEPVQPPASNDDPQKRTTAHKISPRYQLQQLIQAEPGKRTFLATDEHSQSKVVVKLLLYGADPLEDASIDSELTEKDKSNSRHTPLLSYLDSFEVETPIGAALALIKPYTTSAVAHTNLPHQTRRHSDQPKSPFSRNPKSYRPKVTTAPQNSYGGFRVHSTPNKLEIHCLQSHIKEGLTERHQTRPVVEAVELWSAIILGTFGFVGGTIVSTGSILYGVIVAAILPILFHQLTVPRVRQPQKAILRLTNESGGRTFVSLMTVLIPKRSASGYLSPPTESTLHGSSLSIKRIKIEPAFLFSLGVDPLAAAIVITFHKPHHKKRLRIVGSYKEMRWLSHHLSKWGDARPTID